MVADFSIQDAAFTGFGVVREHPGYLAVWAGVALVVSFAFACVFIIMAGPVVPILQTLSMSGARDPTVFFPLMRRLAPLYLIMIPCSVVFYGVLCSAMNRAVLRPSEHKLACLAFGPDEFRQIGLLTLGFFLFGLIYIISVTAVIIVASLFGALVPVPPTVLAPIAVISATFFMTWLAVRLSLASALTFERRRVSFFGSWALTRGRFWPMFGTYLLVFALAVVIYLLTWLVIVALVAVVTGGDVSAAFAPADFRALNRYFTIAQLVQIILQAGVSALIWPVVLTPPAAILRQTLILNRTGLVDPQARGFS